MGARSGVSENGDLWLTNPSDGVEGANGYFALRQVSGSSKLISIPDFGIKDILLLQNGSIAVAGSLYSGKKEGAILWSSDQGSTWNLVYQNADIAVIRKLATDLDGNIWAAGSGGFVANFDGK